MRWLLCLLGVHEEKGVYSRLVKVPSDVVDNALVVRDLQKYVCVHCGRIVYVVVKN